MPHNAAEVLQSILAEEERQQKRIEEAMAHCADAEQDARRMNQEQESAEKEAMMNTAHEELHSYARREPSTILETKKKEAAALAAQIDASAKKMTPIVAEELVHNLLHFTFVSHP